MSPRPFGLIRDPKDARDHDFAPIVRRLGLERATKDLLLDDGRTPISDQGDWPMCTSNGSADAFEYVIPAGSKVVQLSRKYLFQSACAEAGIDGSDGCYVRANMAAASREGLPLEEHYPYGNPYKRGTTKVAKPTLSATREGVAHKISAYYSITARGDARLDQIDAALARNLPVVFGTNVGGAFQDWAPGKDPLKAPTTAQSIGGHAIVIWGRLTSTKGRIYRIRNSWGKAWGDRGYCLFDGSYLIASCTSDLWVPTAGPIFA